MLRKKNSLFISDWSREMMERIAGRGRKRTDDSRQMTEDRKIENRCQRSAVGSQKIIKLGGLDAGRLRCNRKTKQRRRRTEYRGQKSEVGDRRQMPEVGDRKIDDGQRESEGNQAGRLGRWKA
jgi:hypothetical protein